MGGQLKRGDVVVFESTVYPGATEEDCVPVLEQASGLVAGRDFTVGYSPERINPGDKAHRFEAIKKVVAGQDAATLDVIAAVYGSVVTAGLHKAPSIKVAEAAKVIENAQRDLNIAFMNELSAIFHVLGIDTKDVLAAAAHQMEFSQFLARPRGRALHRGRSLLPHVSRARKPATIPKSSWRAAASTTPSADGLRANACAACSRPARGRNWSPCWG